jgi:hypothetical protein
MAKKIKRSTLRRQVHEAKASRCPHVARQPDTRMREFGAAVDEELSALPATYREPLLLCYLEGMTRDRVARRLNVTLRTLDRRLARGRELLRRRLSRQGITLTAGMLAASLADSSAHAAVPALLVASTVKSAAGFATTALNPAASPIAKLACACLRAMATTRLKTLTLVLLGATVVAGGGSLLGHQVYTALEQQEARALVLPRPSPMTGPVEQKTQFGDTRGTGAASADDRTTKDSARTLGPIRDALIKAATKLVDLKIVVAEKGDFTERAPGQPVPVVFKEMWLHSRSAQVRIDDQRDDGKGTEWWTGFRPMNRPLTSADLDSTPGIKACVDMSRDLVFAESRFGRAGKSRTLHSISKLPRMPSNLFVPLVELNKPWVPSERSSGAPVVNEIARRPLSAWRLLADTTLGGEEVILAEIGEHDPVAIPLKRQVGELRLTQVHLVWFAKRYGWMPLRIEKSARYDLRGREYRLERRPDGLSSLVYDASDFVQSGDVWVPRRGRQCTYRPKEQDAKGFDPDALAEKLLADGALRFPGELQLGYSREWRVLSIDPIEPSLELWFEPPAGAEVVNMETHERYVQGDAVPEKQPQRIDRWELSFRTRDGSEYVERLQALGGTLAIPVENRKSGGSAQYRVIRDLSKRPAPSTIEDLAVVRHIWFIERDASSLEALSKALGFEPAPKFVVVFLPKFIEDELRRKALAHARQKNHKARQEDIEQTSFQVIRTDAGFDVQVASQKLKE